MPTLRSRPHKGKAILKIVLALKKRVWFFSPLFPDLVPINFHRFKCSQKLFSLVLCPLTNIEYYIGYYNLVYNASKQGWS